MAWLRGQDAWLPCGCLLVSPNPPGQLKLVSLDVDATQCHSHNCLLVLFHWLPMHCNSMPQASIEALMPKANEVLMICKLDKFWIDVLCLC
jgi:hypothetical protein